MGNLASVMNALNKVESKAVLESNPENIHHYDKLLLPGVGAYGDAMQHLQSNGMDEAIKAFVKSGKPILGICLGMQLLFESSEEFAVDGVIEGLGVIPGRVVAFNEHDFDHPNKIPHMGWNELFVQQNTPLFQNLPQEFYLYFVHSFHAVCDDRYTIGKTHYGYGFVSAVQKENIYGIQPHPE
jgi:glutamine amidotransferase